MLKLLFVPLLALGFMSATPAYADPVAEKVLGTLRDTSQASDWQVKDLGYGDWKTRFNDGAIPYQNAYEYYSGAWADDLPWISPYYDGASPGDYYYSYMTVITDNFNLPGKNVAFSELSLKLAADDQLHAIIINGTLYDNFSPQPLDVVSHASYIQLNISDIVWNVGTPNTIEIIAHDSGGYITGFSGSFQASYLATVVPEPETWAMLLAGLGIVSGVTRRQRMKAVM